MRRVHVDEYLQEVQHTIQGFLDDQAYVGRSSATPKIDVIRRYCSLMNTIGWSTFRFSARDYQSGQRPLILRPFQNLSMLLSHQTHRRPSELGSIIDRRRTRSNGPVEDEVHVEPSKMPKTSEGPSSDEIRNDGEKYQNKSNSKSKARRNELDPDIGEEMIRCIRWRKPLSRNPQSGEYVTFSRSINGGVGQAFASKSDACREIWETYGKDWKTSVVITKTV